VGGTDRVNPSSWPFQVVVTLNEGGTLTRWDITVTGASGSPCHYIVYTNGGGTANAHSF
jgi:hypothetical protein